MAIWKHSTGVLLLGAALLLLGACDDDDSETKTSQDPVTEELQGRWHSTSCAPDGPDGRQVRWYFVDNAFLLFQTEHFGDLTCEAAPDTTLVVFEGEFEPTGETKEIDEGEVDKIDFYFYDGVELGEEAFKQIAFIEDGSLQFGTSDGEFDDDGYPEQLDTDDIYEKVETEE